MNRAMKKSKRTKIRWIGIGIVAIFILYSGVTSFAVGKTDINSPQYTEKEIEVLKRIDSLTVYELINEMNVLNGTESLIPHAVILEEKFAEMRDEDVIEEIKSNDNSLVVRVTLLQLSEQRKHKNSFSNLYHEILEDADRYPSSLRQNAVWLLQKNDENANLLCNIINSENNAVSFNAMKFLYTFSEEKALKLADEIVEKCNLDNAKSLSAAVRTRIRSYSKLTDNEKALFLQKCKYILTETTNIDLNDMVAISLSECNDLNAVKIVLESEKTEAIYKQNCIYENEKIIINGIKNNDVEIINLLKKSPELMIKNTGVELALLSQDAGINMTIPADPAVGYQAYAVYCDGEFYNLDWHAGLMNRSTSKHPDSVIHVSRSLGPVETDSWSGFTGGTDYFGLYQAKSSFSQSKRTKILTTARKLTLQDIGYVLNRQVKFRTTSYLDTTEKGGVDDIVNIRCDGVVEYSYEFNGVRVFGDDKYWDVSNISRNNNEAHKGLLVTPKKQAQNYMSKVTTAKP